MEGHKEVHTTLSPHSPARDPPEPAELIKALQVGTGPPPGRACSLPFCVCLHWPGDVEIYSHVALSACWCLTAAATLLNGSAWLSV